MQNVDGYGVIREYHSKTLSVGIITTNRRMYSREHTSEFRECISENILPSSENVLPKTYFQVPRMYFREYTSKFRECISKNILSSSENVLPRTYFQVPRIYFREHTSKFREYISENIHPINILPCVPVDC